ADADADQPVAGVVALELHGDLAVLVDGHEVAELVAPYAAARGGEDHVERRPARLVLRHRHHGGDGLAFTEGKQVHKSLAARLRRAERQPPDLELVDDAAAREE